MNREKDLMPHPANDPELDRRTTRSGTEEEDVDEPPVTKSGRDVEKA